jgi:hypothetical protein
MACVLSAKEGVVSRLIKLGGSFQAVQLLRNKHFRINFFKVCGPAGYTCNVKARLDEDTVLMRDITEPIIKNSYAI